jgi:DNA-binding response OmpR family regulator
MLVLDDEGDFAGFLSFVLTAHGFKVLAVPSLTINSLRKQFRTTTKR